MRKPKIAPVEPKPIDTYNMLRLYVVQEDNLMDKRLCWGLTTQAFLLAAYGFAHQQRIALRSSFRNKDGFLIEPKTGALAFGDQVFDSLLALIPIAGFASILLVLIANWMAHASVINLEKYWDTRTTADAYKGFPPLVGGGEKRRVPAPFWAPLAFPVLIMCVWVGIGMSQVFAEARHAKLGSIIVASACFIVLSLLLYCVERTKRS